MPVSKSTPFPRLPTIEEREEENTTSHDLPTIYEWEEDILHSRGLPTIEEREEDSTNEALSDIPSESQSLTGSIEGTNGDDRVAVESNSVEEPETPLTNLNERILPRQPPQTKWDLSAPTRNALSLSQRSRIHPGSANPNGDGLDVRAHGNHLSTVGDQVTDATSPNFGEYPISTTHTTEQIIAANIPFGAPALVGAGGFLALSTTKESRFRTHRSPAEIEALVTEQGRKGPPKKLARANLNTTSIPVPNLSAPTELRTGDQIQLQTTGYVEVGAGVSAAYVFQVGARVAVTGEFELTVEKISDHHIEVECIPTFIYGAKIFGDGLIAKAYASLALAQQIGQKFRFDLRTETGRMAYQEALKGIMPGELTSSQLNPAHHSLDLLQGEFPPGITRLRVSRSTAQQRNAKVQAGFGPSSIGARIVKTKTLSLVSDGERSVNQQIHTRATETTIPGRGSKEDGLSGCLQSTTVRLEPDHYETRFDGYRATVYFSDTRVRGDQYATRMVGNLNQDLDAGLPQPAVESSKASGSSPGTLRSRQMEASVEFTPEDIIDFKNTDLTTVDAIGRRHGVSSKAIGNFVHAIGESGDATEAAKKVGDFLRSHGRPGLGVLIKLAKMGPGDIVINTESGAYQDVLSESVNYLRYNGRPLTGHTKKKDITARLLQGEQLRNDLKLSLEMLGDDPVLALAYNHPERDRLKEDLERKLEAIDLALNFTHLTPEDGLGLWHTLGQGWTTRTDSRAQEQILQATGLTLNETGKTHISATARHHNDPTQNEVSLQATSRWLPLFGDGRTLISLKVERTMTEEESATSRSFSVEARITDEELRWQGMNHRFIKTINQAYGLNFQESAVAARGEQQLVLRQSFTEGDLNRIALVPLPTVIEAIAASGVPRDEAETFGWSLSAADSREALVDALKRFIREKGILATGALNRISSHFDAPSSLVLDSFSGAIQSDLASLRKTLSKLTPPLTSTSSTDDVFLRFKETARAFGPFSDLEKRVLDYPFYSDAERSEQKKTLESLSESLHHSVDLTGLNHDAIVNLYLHTTNAWPSPAKEAILRQLKAAGLHLVVTRPVANTRFSEAIRTADDGSSALKCSVSKEGECHQKTFIVGRIGKNAELTGVEAEVTLFKPNTSKAQLLRNFIVPLNQHLDCGAPGIARVPQDPHDRRVVVGMPLSEEELRMLQTLPSGYIQEMATTFSLPSQSVERLVEKLKKASAGEDQARTVSRFLAHNGLLGLGALKALLDIPQHRITVTSVNGLYEKLLAQVKNTLFLYEGTTPTDSLGKKEITARFEKLHEAGKKITLMRRMASTDPWLSDDLLQSSLKEFDRLSHRLNTTLEGTRDKAASA